MVAILIAGGCLQRDQVASSAVAPRRQRHVSPAATAINLINYADCRPSTHSLDAALPFSEPTCSITTMIVW